MAPTNFGVEDVQLIQRSWKAVAGAVASPGQSHEDVLVAIGMQLFYNLYEAHPAVLQMFSFKDEYVQGVENPRLKAHATKVLTTFDSLVAALNNTPTAVRMVEQVASMHIKYGVVRDHYSALFAVVLATCNQVLPQPMDEETRGSWLKLLDVVLSVVDSVTKQQDA